MTTYHLFQPPGNPLEAIADYIFAGDGIYGILDCFGMRTPIPLAPCEVRGLPPLSAWLDGTFTQEDSTLDAELSALAPTYHLLTERNPVFPPVDPHRVYQYVLARQGVFLLAQCTGMRCLLPISPPVELPGLAPAVPFVDLAYPPVGAELVLQILEDAQATRDSNGPIERLYYLLWEHDAWRLVIPEQEATRDSVRAKAITPEYERAFIEGHSHHGYRAKFSHGDDLAEVKGGAFRVYFVLGSIFDRPEVRVRLCVHGYECEVFARTFFQLPQGVSDGVAREWRVLA